MDISEIRSYIENIEKDISLFEEKNFGQRTDAIDFLDFHVVDQIESLREIGLSGESGILKQRAEKLKAGLEQVDDNLFKKLRANMRNGNYAGKAFKDMVNEYFDLNLTAAAEPGYDNLDLFINRLLFPGAIPEQTKDLEPEMVYYQKTPARVVFELAEKCRFTKDDVFFDLGSGLGQAAILINLLTGVTARGIEFEPAFCKYAQDRAAKLNLPGVTFMNADARKADYSAGTVFFLYSPFVGEMLREVLELLRKEALYRKIRVITYGPCTPQAALQNWLRSDGRLDDNIYQQAFFNSI